MKRFILSATIGLSAMAPGAVADGFHGVWQSDFGELRIRQAGNAAKASFCGEYGTTGYVTGYTNGTYARGIFVHADQSTGKLDNKARNTGTFAWHMTKTGEFAGSWRWGDQPVQQGDGAWTGVQKSASTPDGVNWSKAGSHCLSYMLQAPAGLKAWIEAVELSPRSEPQPELKPEPEEPKPDPIPSHVDTAGMTNCAMGLTNPDILWCDVEYSYVDRPLQRAQTGVERVGLDLSECQPGSVEATGTMAGGLRCRPIGVTGSYSRSCDPMYIWSTPASKATKSNARNRYFTRCDGPKLRGSSETLVETSNRDVRYVQGGGRPYRNEYAVSACPTKRFWNENGYLRCSGE